MIRIIYSSYLEIGSPIVLQINSTQIVRTDNGENSDDK